MLENILSNKCNRIIQYNLRRSNKLQPGNIQIITAYYGLNFRSFIYMNFCISIYSTFFSGSVNTPLASVCKKCLLKASTAA